MNKKGFTLIELLAVIVILAIIALIATPIILGIINDAREQSKKRSIEMYAKAIKNAIAKSQLTETPVGPGELSPDFLSTVEYDGSEVVCATRTLNTDGTIYLDGCKVGEKTVNYTYGTKVEDPIIEKTKYYGGGSGNIGEPLPSGYSTSKPIGKSRYLALELDDEENVSAVYTCFVKNGQDYCLKSDAAEYELNQAILDQAFSNGDGSCRHTDVSYSCDEPSGFYTFVQPDGATYAGDTLFFCNTRIPSSSSDFNCYED